MKKFKLFCSAIAALTMLALAGCDLEVPEGDKVEYKTKTKYDAGVTSSKKWDDNLVVGISPMYGTWTLRVTKGDSVVVDETIKGAEAWWDNRVDSSATSILEGETVVLEMRCITEGTAALAFHCHNDTGWWWYNPGDGNAWGDDPLEATYTKSFAGSTRNVSMGRKFIFTITRKGNDLIWDFWEFKDEEAN